jgi:hypothetical protein
MFLVHSYFLVPLFIHISLADVYIQAYMCASVHNANKLACVHAYVCAYPKHDALYAYQVRTQRIASPQPTYSPPLPHSPPAGRSAHTPSHHTSQNPEDKQQGAPFLPPELREERGAGGTEGGGERMQRLTRGRQPLVSSCQFTAKT